MKKTANYKIMRITYVFLLYLFATGVSMAQNLNCLVVSYNNGEEVSFMFSENPVITFSEDRPDEMTVTTDKTTVIFTTYFLNSMKTVDGSTVSVKTTVSDDNISYNSSEDALIFNVRSSAANLNVYKIDGSKVLSRVLKTGQTVLSMETLPQGSLIIKLNNQTFKIYKR